MSKPCGYDGCSGLFICADTNEVNRCDACAVFQDDKDAASKVRSVLKAAPDMLKALQVAQALITELPGVYADEYIQIQEAIARAEGRTE